MGVPINPSRSGTISETGAISGDFNTDDFESYGNKGIVVVLGIDDIGGYDAAGTAVRSGTTVGSVTVTNGGTNYPNSGSVSFTGGGGSGAAGTYTAVDGIIQSVAIDTAGTGYTSTPTPVFDSGATTEAITLSVEGLNEATGNHWLIAQYGPFDAADTYVSSLYPLAFTPAEGTHVIGVLPRVLRLSLTTTGTAAFNCTLYYSLLP